MNIFQFCDWLAGYLDAVGEVKKPNEKQWAMIMNKFKSTQRLETPTNFSAPLAPCSDH